MMQGGGGVNKDHAGRERSQTQLREGRGVDRAKGERRELDSAKGDWREKGSRRETSCKPLLCSSLIPEISQ